MAKGGLKSRKRLWEGIIEIRINENISLLDELRLQARVLIPIIRALREELGEQRANRIVSGALLDSSRSEVQSRGSDIKGSPREKWASVTSAYMRRIGNDIDIEWIKRDPNEMELNVTGCRYADFFGQLDEAELGYVLLCEPDRYIAELGVPEVEFTRTQTIMHGAEYCDLRYRMKSQTEIR